MKSIAFLLTMVYSSPKLPQCVETDIQCFKLHLADELLHTDDLQQQLDATKGQLSLAQQAEKIALDTAGVANNYAQKIQAAGQSHWYESPTLWFALGFLCASAVAIGIAAAINHVTR